MQRGNKWNIESTWIQILKTTTACAGWLEGLLIGIHFDPNEPFCRGERSSFSAREWSVGANWTDRICGRMKSWNLKCGLGCGGGRITNVGINWESAYWSPASWPLLKGEPRNLIWLDGLNPARNYLFKHKKSTDPFQMTPSIYLCAKSSFDGVGVWGLVKHQIDLLAVFPLWLL